MIYTMKNAGMGLDTAKRVMAEPEQYTAEQKARALVVVSYWKRIRRNQQQKRRA